ncbi:MAG: 2-oxoacid:acceptor oxidoreductase family protein [Promethearchaeota archaeon]
MSSGKIRNDIGIRICGIGGMGVILTSIILGKAAIYDNKNAIQTQSYGAEQRGSKVWSDVIISEKNSINYPVIDNPDILIALSQDAFNKFFPYVKENGITIINSDLVQNDGKSKNLYQLPATSMATKLNFEKGANIIILGALIKITGIVSKESILKSISDTVPEKYIELNFQAFQQGFNY